MNKLVALLLVLLYSVVISGCTGDAKRVDEIPRRNVVLIVADDHSQDLGAYGNPVVRTPNLDRLAAEGTVFKHHYATTASCSASRSVILSGLQNHATGQYGHQHDFHHFVSFDHVRSLPVLLSDSGYRTATVGTFHVAPRDVYQFDSFLAGHSRSSIEMAEAASYRNRVRRRGTILSVLRVV